MRPLLLLLTLLALPLAAGCASAQQSSATGPTLRADSVAVGASGVMGTPVGPFTLYSLTENRVVPNADSASTAWDIGLRGTTVIVNGGTSGPGEGAAVLVGADFETVTSAPEAPLVSDGAGDCGSREPLAVCTGSDNGWYTYGNSGVQPIPEQTLVVRRADGDGLVKVRFLSYVLSEPLPDGSRPRYYAFEFAPLGQ
ncbi:MAG: HmuY family protein [Bacteroidota bacterium]